MRKRTLIPLIILLIIIGGIYYLSTLDSRVSNIDTSDWTSFENEKYGFELNYPADDWNIAEYPDHQLAPHFNFYIKPAGVPVKEPFIHFANITNVSVFPQGIGTEGLIGQARDLGDGWGDNVSEKNSRVYVLEDGTPFAAYIQFKEAPDSWNQSGYAWARLRSENLERVCSRDGVEIGPEEECDSLGDESITIKHRGEVDESLWPVLKKVVQSIEFNR